MRKINKVCGSILKQLEIPDNLEYCCEFIEQQLNYDCKQHGSGCPDIGIRLTKNIELMLIAPNAEYICNYCPSCGKKWSKER